jgi:ERCC4-type nuclease
VLEAMESYLDVHLATARLRVGDYRVEEAMLFERKTCRDFAASLVDHRLFRQAARLASAGEPGILILEGHADDLRDCGVRREALQGAMITVSVGFGLSVLRSRDPAETARILRYAGWQKRRMSQGAFSRAGCRPKGRRKRQLYILQSLPHVGPARAARLIEAFGSVENVFLAEVEELSRVDGIGRATARAIRSLVGGTVESM